MKHLFATLALSAAALMVAPTLVRAQTTELSNRDDATIRKTLDDLGTAADKRDLNTFASFFVQSPDLYYQITTVDNKIVLARGIDNLSLSCVVAALLATPSLVNGQASTVSQSDLLAIKTVIEHETTSWNNRDAAGMTDCWANVPEAGQLVSLQDGKGTVISNHNTGLDMAAGIKTTLASMGPAGKETFQNTDYQIRISGSAAFAQFEQTVTAADGKKEFAHETRYLEKMGGKWKIVHVGAAFYVPTK